MRRTRGGFGPAPAGRWRVVPSLLLVLLAGCALPQLAWERADDLVLDRVNDWLQLEPRQQARLMERLQPWLAELRRKEMGPFAGYLEQLATRIRPGLDAADARWAERRFRVFYERVAGSFLPIITPTLADLSAVQRRHLASRMEAENEEDRARFSDARDQGRYALAERVIKQVERWTGPLETGQRALIHERVRGLPATGAAWLDYRRAMQRRLLQQLERGASAAELERTLYAWWIEQAGRPPALQAAVDELRTGIRTTLVAVAATLSPLQRAEARRRLQARAADLRSLAESAPGP